MPCLSVSSDHGNEHAIANEIGRPAFLGEDVPSSQLYAETRWVHATQNSDFRSVDEIPIDTYDGRSEFKRTFLVLEYSIKKFFCIIKNFSFSLSLSWAIF